jgi:glycosyltransferase involved in cell wall biosynthesis
MCGRFLAAIRVGTPDGSTRSSVAGKPLVSVVVPTHNRPTQLRRAVDSVLRQTYRQLELIVVDDCGEIEAAAGLAGIHDERLSVIRRMENGGASAARNTGIEAARGEMIGFLDDDDEWLPTKLERQVPVLDGAPQSVALVYCWMDYFNNDGDLIGEVHPTLRGNVFDRTLVYQPIGGCPTLLVRSEAVRAVGGFEERLRRGNDGEFIRSIARDHEVDLVPEVLVRVHTGHGPRISDDTVLALERVILAYEFRLQKYAADFTVHRARHGDLLRRLAVTHSRLHHYQRGALTFGKALRIDPLSIRIPRDLIHAIRAALTPRPSAQ